MADTVASCWGLCYMDEHEVPLTAPVVLPRRQHIHPLSPVRVLNRVPVLLFHPCGSKCA
jgi:hypothetical protein